MLLIDEISIIMKVERKSFDQALFYLYRVRNNLSLEKLSEDLNLSIKIIKIIEGNQTSRKRVSYRITKYLLNYYNINIDWYIAYRKNANANTVSFDMAVNFYSKYFNFSKCKATLFIHSRMYGYTHKEYLKLIRLSRVNLNKEDRKNVIFNKMITQNGIYLL